jgi:UDP-N-acetylmuramate dehydrogenase
MVYHQYSLKRLNTFGLDVYADYFSAPATVDGLLALLSGKALPLLILGGGSNVLFLDDFKGLIIQPQIKDIEKTGEDEASVYLRVGAGVVWDDFVEYAVQNNYGGIENLSLIPGHVGAAPVQNIGAYGVEAKEVIRQVEGIVRATGKRKVFTNADCAFGYRESTFKHTWKDRIVVTHVTFCLAKKPVLCTHYGNVEEELKNYPEVTLQTVRQAVMAIRRKKLPDPAAWGNAGSFFKNPVVSRSLATAILAKDPAMTIYPVDDAQVKLPAGRLIEQAGWKGKRMGHVGVHTQQALVLVNYGGGTGREILSLATAIQQSVLEKFGIQLEMEVSVVPSGSTPGII